jgi:hypothetical protein
MKLAGFCFILPLGLLLSARADLTIVQKVEGGGQGADMTIKIKGDKARIEASPQVTMIVDAKTGEIIHLMNDQKTVVHMSAEKMKAAMDTLNKFNGKDETAAKPKLTATGKKESINGYETEQYVYETPSFKAVYWIASKYPNASVILKQLEVLNSGTWNPKNNAMPDYRDFPGLPIKFVVTVGGNQVTTTVTAIKEDSLSDSEFTVPKDFQELKAPEMKLGPPQDEMKPAAGSSPKP